MSLAIQRLWLEEFASLRIISKENFREMRLPLTPKEFARQTRNFCENAKVRKERGIGRGRRRMREEEENEGGGGE